MKQHEAIQLAFKLEQNRESIQKKLDSGTPATELAKDYGVVPSSMRKILKNTGFNFSRGQHSRKPTLLLSEILTVIQRICVQLDIPHDEIKKYL